MISKHINIGKNMFSLMTSVLVLFTFVVLLPSFALATHRNFDTESNVQTTQSKVTPTLTTTPIEQTKTPTAYKRNPLTLTVGSSGIRVSQLQTFLRSTGDFTYPTITGYFGIVTAKAVQKYQCRLSIVCSGTPITTGYGQVGPSTRRAITNNSNRVTTIGAGTTSTQVIPTTTQTNTLTLKRSLYIGTRGSDVRQLQLFLKNTGDFTYPTITGYYGKVTERAVQRYQRRMNIISYGTPLTTGYGVVGPKTRRELAKKKDKLIVNPPTPIPTPYPIPQPVPNPTPYPTPITPTPNPQPTPIPVPTPPKSDTACIIGSGIIGKCFIK